MFLSLVFTHENEAGPRISDDRPRVRPGLQREPKQQPAAAVELDEIRVAEIDAGRNPTALAWSALRAGLDPDNAAAIKRR